MGLILTDADLGNSAKKTSTPIVPTALWRVTAIITGANVSDVTEVRVKARADADAYVPATDDKGRYIKFRVHGNGRKAIVVASLTATGAVIEVVPDKNGKGLCSIDSYLPA